jgi:hypothetical protein
MSGVTQKEAMDVVKKAALTMGGEVRTAILIQVLHDSSCKINNAHFSPADLTLAHALLGKIVADQINRIFV